MGITVCKDFWTLICDILWSEGNDLLLGQGISWSLTPSTDTNRLTHPEIFCQKFHSFSQALRIVSLIQWVEASLKGGPPKPFRTVKRDILRFMSVASRFSLTLLVEVKRSLQNDYSLALVWFFKDDDDFQWDFLPCLFCNLWYVILRTFVCLKVPDNSIGKGSYLNNISNLCLSFHLLHQMHCQLDRNIVA